MRPPAHIRGLRPILDRRSNLEPQTKGCTRPPNTRNHVRRPTTDLATKKMGRRTSHSHKPREQHFTGAGDLQPGQILASAYEPHWVQPCEIRTSVAARDLITTSRYAIPHNVPLQHSQRPAFSHLRIAQHCSSRATHGDPEPAGPTAISGADSKIREISSTAESKTSAPSTPHSSPDWLPGDGCLVCPVFASQFGFQPPQAMP